MSHLIDNTTGINAIAFAGETPWHGLGQSMQPGMSIEDWQQQAGLGFHVHRSPVRYMNGIEHTFDGRDVLYRDDTGAPLSIVSSQYKPVQPAEVMDFFRQIIDVSGFTMESAGALQGGKRIWALAKVNDGAEVVDRDVVMPYLLLATSYDASMATVAKFTTVRVVCQNTLSMSNRDASHMVRVLHRERFNANKVREELGIVTGQFDQFMLRAKRLSMATLSAEQADALTFDLLAPTVSAAPGRPLPDVRKTKGFTRVMELFNGQAKGAELVGNTAWGWVNAVTEMVDWERGRSQDTRINSAWFGSGELLKNRAATLAEKLAVAL